MENQKSNSLFQEYQLKLNALILAPVQQNLVNFFQGNGFELKQALFWCDTSFLGRVEKDLILSKKKILEQLLKVYPLLQKEEIKLFRNKIKNLTMSTEIILKDGIISLYSDLSEQKLNKQQGFSQTQLDKLITKTQKILQVLLRHHFMLRQIEKIDNKFSKSSIKVIMSEKKIIGSDQSLTSINSAHSIKQILSDHALQQISKNIQTKSIQQLINQQLKGEQNEINEGFQTCRICKNSFKFKNLQKHVSYCSRIESHRSKRDQIIKNQLSLIEQMKKQISRDNSIFQVNQNQLCFQVNKIYKNIINSFQYNTKRNKRGSVCHNKRVVKRLSMEIDQFLLQNTQNQILLKYKEFRKQRQFVEKKIYSLQQNYLHSKKQNFNNDHTNLSQIQSYNQYQKTSHKHNKIVKMASVKTKKSLFARKLSSASGSSDTNLFEQILKTQSIKNHLDQIIGTQSQQEDIESKLYKSLSNFNKDQQMDIRQISIQDFQVIKYIGKGAFGKVYMVRRKMTKDIYALKMIKIQPNWDQKQLQSIKNQHQILSKIAGQHLVKAPFSFSQGSAHFFVLQYMPGGDLAKIIQQQVYLDYKQSQFYLAQIVLAIQHLHTFGIIHRDLKPQNLIFDENGHLMLTDFGLSEMRISDKIRKVKKMNNSVVIEFQKRISQQENIDKKQRKQGKLKSAYVQQKNKVRLVGTPDYIAPQIISGQSLDNLSIDWWSFGVIAYEMMVGSRPFCANTVNQVLNNITQFNIQWPQIGDQQDMISPIAADFIKKLLNKNYTQRLGANGVTQIKQHPFFDGVNWQDIKNLKPPLMPKMDKKQFYEDYEQQQDLKEQIKKAICSNQAKSSFKLQNFVRYDILVSETLESADKQLVKKSVKIKKLKSIVSSMENSSVENKDQRKDQIIDLSQNLINVELQNEKNKELKEENQIREVKDQDNQNKN